MLHLKQLLSPLDLRLLPPAQAPLLPLSYFFLKRRINSFWAVFKAETSSNGRQWLFTHVLAHLATSRGLYLQPDALVF